MANIRSEDDHPSRRIRILHVAATSTGGVGLLLLYLSKYMNRERFNVSVAFGRGYLLDERFEDEGIPIIELPVSRGRNPISVLRALFCIYKILRRGQYDVIQSHTSVGGFIARIAGFVARVPWSIWTIHGYASHPGQSKIAHRGLLVLERALDKLTNHYVAVSEDMKTSGIEKRIFPADKATVIYNGIDIEEIDSLADSPLDLAKLGFATDSLIIGTITRLEPQKAINQFLQASARVAEHCPKAVFLIAGDGPLRAELEALSRRLDLSDKVRFLGWRRDAIAVLRTLDIFCMSSRWEGCPMVLLEAMAVARPVVATTVGGVGELVVDGQTGLLVPPDSPDDLADALLRLTSSAPLRQRLGAAGRRRVEERFSVVEMASRYDEFYRQLTGRGEVRE